MICMSDGWVQLELEMKGADLWKDHVPTIKMWDYCEVCDVKYRS